MKKQTIPKYLDCNGSLIRHRRQIACQFNEYFTNIATDLNKNVPNDVIQNSNFRKYLKNRVVHSMYLTDIDSNEITKIISDFNDNKSTDFYPRALKLVKFDIAPVLAMLFNNCMYSGVFPDELKLAKVLPLHKSGNINAVSNYRPISILPIFSKIFEKLLYNRLYDFLDKNNVLYKRQFGFRRQHLTTHALNTAITTVTAVLDKNYKSLGIFIDFSKAFDTINHINK